MQAPEEFVAQINESTSCVDLARLVLRSEIQDFLALNSKQPIARKVVLQLSNPNEIGVVSDREIVFAAIATLWLKRELRGIVDEFSARLLKDPVVGHFVQCSEQESLAIAEWMGSKICPWTLNFSAAMILVNSSSPALIREWSQTLCHAAGVVDVAIAVVAEMVVEKLPSVDSRKAVVLNFFLGCASGKFTPGKNFGSNLLMLVKASGHATNASVASGESMAESEALSLLTFLQTYSLRYPQLIFTESFVEIFLFCEASCEPLKKNKKWIKSKKDIAKGFEVFLAADAIRGRNDSRLLKSYQFLDSSKDSVAKASRDVIRSWQINDPSTCEWLEDLASGRLDARSDFDSDSKSAETLDADMLANLLIVAVQLRNMPPPEALSSTSLERVQILVTGIETLASRLGLAVNHVAEQIVEFDPSRQRLVNGEPSKLVRVLVPGVMRNTRGSRAVQQIPAIVEPMK